MTAIVVRGSAAIGIVIGPSRRAAAACSAGQPAEGHRRMARDHARCICGSFSGRALVLKPALEDRIAAVGSVGSCRRSSPDLDSLTETEIEYDG